MKTKVTFLDLVIPFCCIYTSGLVFYSYFIGMHYRNNPFIDIFIIMITSTFFVYGVFSFVRDLYRLGFLDTVKSFIKGMNGIK